MAQLPFRRAPRDLPRCGAKPLLQGVGGAEGGGVAAASPPFFTLAGLREEDVQVDSFLIFGAVLVTAAAAAWFASPWAAAAVLAAGQLFPLFAQLGRS